MGFVSLSPNVYTKILERPTVGWYLDQERVTQAAAHLLNRGGIGRMQYLKALKLLYWAHRESLRETGLPLTGDTPVAMKLGPVLSEVYNYIKSDDLTDHACWDQYLQREGYDLVLKADPGTTKLSRFDLRVLDAAFDQHAGRDGFEMSELTHEFPEWEEANLRRSLDGRGSEPIDMQSMMRAVGCSREQIEGALAARDEERGYFRFFAGLSNANEPAAR